MAEDEIEVDYGDEALDDVISLGGQEDEEAAVEAQVEEVTLPAPLAASASAQPAPPQPDSTASTAATTSAHTLPAKPSAPLPSKPDFLASFQSGLPPPWTARQSKSNREQVYFFNPVTNETQWERPTSGGNPRPATTEMERKPSGSKHDEPGRPPVAATSRTYRPPSPLPSRRSPPPPARRRSLSPLPRRRDDRYPSPPADRPRRDRERSPLLPRDPPPRERERSPLLPRERSPLPPRPPRRASHSPPLAPRPSYDTYRPSQSSSSSARRDAPPPARPSRWGAKEAPRAEDRAPEAPAKPPTRSPPREMPSKPVGVAAAPPLVGGERPRPEVSEGSSWGTSTTSAPAAPLAAKKDGWPESRPRERLSDPTNTWAKPAGPAASSSARSGQRDAGWSAVQRRPSVDLRRSAGAPAQAAEDAQQRPAAPVPTGPRAMLTDEEKRRREARSAEAQRRMDREKELASATASAASTRTRTPSPPPQLQPPQQEAERTVSGHIHADRLRMLERQHAPALASITRERDNAKEQDLKQQLRRNKTSAPPSPASPAKSTKAAAASIQLIPTEKPGGPGMASRLAWGDEPVPLPPVAATRDQARAASQDAPTPKVDTAQLNLPWAFRTKAVDSAKGAAASVASVIPTGPKALNGPQADAPPIPTGPRNARGRNATWPASPGKAATPASGDSSWVGQANGTTKNERPPSRTERPPSRTETQARTDSHAWSDSHSRNNSQSQVDARHRREPSGTQPSQPPAKQATEPELPRLTAAALIHPDRLRQQQQAAPGAPRPPQPVRAPPSEEWEWAKPNEAAIKVHRGRSMNGPQAHASQANNVPLAKRAHPGWGAPEEVAPAKRPRRDESADRPAQRMEVDEREPPAQVNAAPRRPSPPRARPPQPPRSGRPPVDHGWGARTPKPAEPASSTVAWESADGSASRKASNEEATRVKPSISIRDRAQAAANSGGPAGPVQVAAAAVAKLQEARSSGWPAEPARAAPSKAQDGRDSVSVPKAAPRSLMDRVTPAVPASASLSSRLSVPSGSASESLIRFGGSSPSASPNLQSRLLPPTQNLPPRPQAAYGGRGGGRR